MDAYCFSNQCINNTLRKNIDYKKLLGRREAIVYKLKNKKNINKKKLKKEFYAIGKKLREMTIKTVWRGGVLKKGHFCVGDDCPDCGWSLKIGKNNISIFN